MAVDRLRCVCVCVCAHVVQKMCICERMRTQSLRSCVLTFCRCYIMSSQVYIIMCNSCVLNINKRTDSSVSLHMLTGI